METIVRLVKETGLTIIMATHYKVLSEENMKNVFNISSRILTYDGEEGKSSFISREIGINEREIEKIEEFNIPYVVIDFNSIKEQQDRL